MLSHSKTVKSLNDNTLCHVNQRELWKTGELWPEQPGLLCVIEQCCVKVLCAQCVCNMPDFSVYSKFTHCDRLIIYT